MAFHVKDAATDAAVRRLAKLKHQTLTETIREAVEHEYARVRSEIPLIERLKRDAVSGTVDRSLETLVTAGNLIRVTSEGGSCRPYPSGGPLTTRRRPSR